ncbi:hypothetical protein GWA97_08705 [Flavobacterium sp. LaA7.5]|nr:hypothetical protein [Flavobacterium salilacus subsp. altitudinum]
MEIGDILKASHRSFEKGKHYIIFLEGYNKNNFLGAMITHSDKYGNIPFIVEHFEELDNEGVNYEIVYDNSYLVQGVFIKPKEWGPFEKVGKLTQNGIEYINKHLEGLVPISFSEYFNKRLQ